MHIPRQVSRGHISPTITYFIVGAALLVLTAITVGASYIDLGSILVNFVVAMLIASVKASLVLLYFMHMKYESKLIWMFGILYPILLFALMTGMIVIDTFQRVIPNP
jgi:cytochrome c oxidase subunit 4